MKKQKTVKEKKAGAPKNAKPLAKSGGVKGSGANKTSSKKKPKTAGVRAGAQNTDIIRLILEDHKPLKKLIKVMKSDADVSERKAAFEEFAPLLIAHAKPEEKALYTFMKNDEDLREEAFEGDVEHILADQMVEEAKRTDDEDLLGARIKVLAELVEHHIKEEESDLLPDFKKASSVEDRAMLGETFLKLKEKIVSEGSDDAPPERTIAEKNQERVMHS